MLNDYYSENGEEEAVARMLANDIDLNLTVFAPGITDIGEPYFIVFKNLYNNCETLDARISLVNPKYIQYDKKLISEEISWVSDVILNNWNSIIDIIEYYFENKDSAWSKSIVQTPINIPDYRQL